MSETPQEREQPESVTARTMALIKAEWRKEWEDELLSDEAVDRVARQMVGIIGPGDPYVANVRRILRAVLGVTQ